MYDRTHVDFDVYLKRFPGIMVFSPDMVGYKTLYLIVRTSISHHSDCQGGRPMGKWVLASLDNIIEDFMSQLQTATEQGWQRTKPDHYRSILAALESALTERRELLAARASEPRDQPASYMAEPRLTAPAWPLPLRWSFMRPLRCPVPSRGH
jgi:hypothetical protein